MTIFDVLQMIGGLCQFLFGMSVMGDGLERRAGNSLKTLLSKITGSKIKGFLTGLGVTAVIQSSSATTVMVVGFIWSDLLTDMERMSDHCSNIAVSIIDAHGHNMDAHHHLRSMREGNPAFAEQLETFVRKYSLPAE